MHGAERCEIKQRWSVVPTALSDARRRRVGSGGGSGLLTLAYALRVDGGLAEGHAASLREEQRRARHGWGARLCLCVLRIT